MSISDVPQRKRGDIEKARRYIQSKIVHQEELENKTMTKKQLGLDAGYALSTVENSVLEKSNIYTDLSHEYIHRTSFSLDKVLDMIKNDVENGDMEELPLMQKLRAASILMTIYKGLLPTYKKKETKRDIDGTITSVWTTINQ